MTSNSSRSRVLNLVYRLINAFEGKNADIERSGLYKHYDVNKYSVKISLNNRKTKALKERLENALLGKGFVDHNVGKTYHCFMSPDGVAVNITNTEDFLNRKALDVFIY
jgi:hypothetical protein